MGMCGLKRRFRKSDMLPFLASSHLSRGPDTVDEFLYEVNALHQLSGSRSVIQFGGVVVDAAGEYVKGLLIAHAEQGALVDVIYDGDGRLTWLRREKWARQIVDGLSEIHEAGFVQGDFTLSNIVIDDNDDAKIIDINRRGCPVGWEPPEVAALLDSRQRISMYIGVKSDLYQLGMVLYALGMQQDEPEKHRPLDPLSLPAEIPKYYYEICQRCLSSKPQLRSPAHALLDLFPDGDNDDYRVCGRPTPIVVDVMPADEDAFQVSYPDREHTHSGSRPPYRYARASPSPSRSRTMTETSDAQSDYPRRGRSPGRPRYADEPLPLYMRSYYTSESLQAEPVKSSADFEIVEDVHVEELEPATLDTKTSTNVFSFLQTDPASPLAVPLPASNNTSYVSLPLSTKCSSTSLTPKARHKSSQALKPVLTERPCNIVSPSPSFQSLKELLTADAGPMHSQQYPPSPVSQKSGCEMETVSHNGTTTNTPFTPYTPNLNGDGFVTTASAEDASSETDLDRTVRRKHGFSGDFTGIGMCFAQEPASSGDVHVDGEGADDVVFLTDPGHDLHCRSHSGRSIDGLGIETGTTPASLSA